MDYDKPYNPSGYELSVVAELQRQGAPKKVEFVAEEAEGPFAGWVTRNIRFTADNGKVYEGESWRVCAWPQISFVEMKTLGMISN